MVPIIIKGVGIDGFGFYSSLVAMVALFTVIADLGLEMYLSKEVSRVRANTGIVNSLTIDFLFVRIGASLIGVVPIIYLLDVSFSNPSFEVSTSLLVVYFILINLRPLCIMQGLEKYKESSIVEFFSKILILVFLFLMDFSEDGINKAILALLIPLFFTNVTYYILLLGNGKDDKYKFSTLRLRKLIKDSSGFYFSRLFTNLYLSSSPYLVSLFLKSDLVGIYSVIMQLYKSAQMLTSAISKVLYTRSMLNNIMFIALRLSVITLILFIVFAPFIHVYSSDAISFIFNVEYVGLSNYILLISLSVLFHSISSFIGYPILVSFNMENNAHLGVFVSGVMYYLFFLSVGFLIGHDLFTVLFSILVADLTSLLIRGFQVSRLYLSIEKIV